MQSTKDEIEFHCERLLGGATRSEQAESIGFLSRLADDNKLPDRIDADLPDVFITVLKDKRRMASTRANAMNVIEKLLAGRMKSLVHALLERGILDLLCEIVVGDNDELRAASALAARHISDCCTKCKTKLCKSEVDSSIMQQVLEGGFDASAAATRGAVGVILSTISIRLGYRKGALLYPTVVRDQLFPALARSLNKYGAADDDELGKTVLTALCRTYKYEPMGSQSALLAYVASVVAQAPDNKRELFGSALELMEGILPFATPAQMRLIVDHPGFMIGVTRLAHGGRTDGRGAAEHILQSIASAPTDVFAHVVLQSAPLVFALAAPIRPFKYFDGRGAIMILMKLLVATTAGGPTTQSDIVRYVLEHYYDTRDEVVEITRSALNSVLGAHPEFTRLLHDAGANRWPLQVAMRLRPARQPQQYIIIDEDCEAI